MSLIVGSVFLADDDTSLLLFAYGMRASVFILCFFCHSARGIHRLSKAVGTAEGPEHDASSSTAFCHGNNGPISNSSTTRSDNAASWRIQRHLSNSFSERQSFLVRAWEGTFILFTVVNNGHSA
jgi:hypothetical protein